MGSVDNVSDVVCCRSDDENGVFAGRELAVSDGAKVTRYPLAFFQISGGGGRVAGIVDGSRERWMHAAEISLAFDVSAPVGTLIDTAGRLVVATENARCIESGSSLEAV